MKIVKVFFLESRSGSVLFSLKSGPGSSRRSDPDPAFLEGRIRILLFSKLDPDPGKLTQIRNPAETTLEEMANGCPDFRGVPASPGLKSVTKYMT